MIIAVDSTALVLIVNPGARPPIDPSTGSPVEHMQERVAKLIAEVDEKKHVLLVPTPVLAEVLVKAGEGGPEFVRKLRRLARIRIAPFDERSAFELAAMTAEAVTNGGKRGGHDQPWQKVKLDRQIIAIARVHSAGRIYSDDEKLVGFARRLGLVADSSWDLPVPENVADLFTVAGLTAEPNAQSDYNEQDAPTVSNSPLAPDSRAPRRLIDIGHNGTSAEVSGDSTQPVPREARPETP